jgi:prepilin-type N-terminal cleavage/methylation domain-containing protein
MNNSKGFTMVEMMVAAGILAIALAGAMSFFIFQSQSGADSGKLKAARENLSLALTMLQRDIMVAGYGVWGVANVPNPRRLSLAIMANWGIDNVTGDVFNSLDATWWDVAGLPRLTAGDNFLRAGAQFRPDKLYVGYGNFLDMSFDINNMNDTNSASALRTRPTAQPPPMPRPILPPEPLAAAANNFVYDLFQYAPLTVTNATRPLGGFLSDAAGGAATAADVDWARTGNPATNAPPWTFFLTPGQNLVGNVVPAVVYRIARDANRPTFELQRNGVRIAGGDPGLEVYNLTVIDQSAGNQRLLSVRIDYQVMLTGAASEANLHGTAKTTWYKGWVTIEADPRIIVMYDGLAGG